MKHFYIVADCDYTGNRNYYRPGENQDAQKYCAFVITATQGDNLMRRLGVIGGLRSATLCETKKAAEAVAFFRNERYKADGTYAL